MKVKSRIAVNISNYARIIILSIISWINNGTNNFCMRCRQTTCTRDMNCWSSKLFLRTPFLNHPITNMSRIASQSVSCLSLDRAVRSGAMNEKPRHFREERESFKAQREHIKFTWVILIALLHPSTPCCDLLNNISSLIVLQSQFQSVSQIVGDSV